MGNNKYSNINMKFLNILLFIAVETFFLVQEVLFLVFTEFACYFLLTVA